MPVFAALVASLFGSLASFFAAWVTKKTALGLAAVTVFGLLTVALMALIATSVNAALSMDALPAGVVTGFAMFMPDNFTACMSSIIAAKIAVALYRWNVKNLELLAYVS